LQKSNQSKINTDSNFTEQQTWWQTQSSLCGVPDGIQYGLDKDRSHRIKALGNSIVPQIVTEIGKAIIKAEEENV
jgi:site-specific DNA-cytosine methylase